MAYELEFEDMFTGATLDRTRWLPYYLPHWSSRERAAARYTVADGLLRLLIDAEQQAWCPELDGDVRVSSLQTATIDGQHRFSAGAQVREAQTPIRLYTPHFGRVEVRARATDDPAAMVAFWLIGYEDEPEHSAEICVCEIFGRDVGAESAIVGLGVHPFGDPLIVDDFERIEVPIDAREFHIYAVDWTRDGVTFAIDGERVKTVEQSPDYPLQLMLSLYDFRDTAAGSYPKEFVVDWVRGYRLT
jgi:Glycosyl hydrolases family 16